MAGEDDAAATTINSSTSTTTTTTHRGSCHCGAVRFTVDAKITELTTCDCSLCVKRNAVMAKVPQDALTVTAGEEALAL